MEQSFKIKNFQEYEFSLACTPQLVALTQSIRDNFPISHVWISRYYFCGSYLDIGTDIRWKKEMCVNGWYDDFVLSFFDGFNYSSKSHSHFVLWSAEAYSQSNLLVQIKTTCSILSGFNLFFIRDNFIENYGFGSFLPINQLSKIISSTQDSLKNFTFSLRSLMEDIAKLL